MQPGEHTVTHTISRYRSFRYGLILEGVVVGALTGVVVAIFRYLIGFANILLNIILGNDRNRTWFVSVWALILAAAACVVSPLLKWDSLISGNGIPQIEGEVIREINEKWWRVLLAKLSDDIISLGCGLSLGRKDPGTQLRAMTVKRLPRAAKRIKTEEKLPATCGVSAGLSAVFNAPIVGILFALEEVHKHFSPELLLLSVAASITSGFVSRNVFGLTPIFFFHIIHTMSLNTYGRVLVLGVIMGAMGVVYNTTLPKTQGLYGEILWDTVELLTPLLLVGIFGFTYRNILGGGHALVEKLSMGEMVLGALCLLLAVKSASSMISFGSGTPGGIFLSLLVMGAIIESIHYDTASLVSPSPGGLVGNFIIPGMAGCPSATVRAPIASIILTGEMTGSFSHLLTLPMVPLAACLVPGMVYHASVYDQSSRHFLAKQSSDKKVTLAGEKVLMEGTIYYRSAAEGKKASAIAWSRTSLMVSPMRGEAKPVPRGNTMLRAGDKVVMLRDEASQGQPHRALQKYCETIAPTQKGQ